MNLLHLTMPVQNWALLSELYNYMNYADVILTCSDSFTNHQQRPVAHKLVLSNCSHFLKELLETNMDSHELIIPDVSTSAMVRILELLYTGEVRVEGEEQVSEVVEGIQLLGINSVVNSIQFSQEEDHDQIPTNEEMLLQQQNWPTSELISPVSLDDDDDENLSSHFWTDSTNDNGMGSELSEMEINCNDLVYHQHEQPESSKKKKAKEEIVQHSVKKVKKSILKKRTKKKAPISTTATCQSKITLPDSKQHKKTDNIINNDTDNQFNQLVFIDSHAVLAFCDAFPQNEAGLIQNKTHLQLQDHSYASNRMHRI